MMKYMARVLNHCVEDTISRSYNSDDIIFDHTNDSFPAEILIIKYFQVFVKLMRRYKYLEKMFEEEMKKVCY